MAAGQPASMSCVSGQGTTKEMSATLQGWKPHIFCEGVCGLGCHADVAARYGDQRAGCACRSLQGAHGVRAPARTAQKHMGAALLLLLTEPLCHQKS